MLLNETPPHENFLRTPLHRLMLLSDLGLKTVLL